MASLFKRRKKSGGYTWYVTFFRDGKAQMRSTGTSDKHLAKEILGKIATNNIRMAEGLDPVSEIVPIMLSEFVAVYLQERYRLNMAQSTISTDSYALNRLQHYTGDCRMTTINGDIVRRYRDHKLTYLKPTSVAIELRHLKAAFSWAVEKPGTKYLRANPFKQRGLIPSSVKPSVPPCLSPDEKQRFFDAIDDPEHKLMFQFMLLTGCRRGEVVKLCWEDFDLQKHLLIFQKTKSGQDRVIPISLELMQILVNLDRSKPKPFPYHPDWLTHLFKKYLRGSGIEKDFHLHCLRHTAATDLLRQRVPLIQIKEFLGHSSVKVTEIYTHALPEDMRQLAEALTCVG